MIQFYEVDDEYIRYLRSIDNKVLSEKFGNRDQTRKYIGIIFNNQSFKYFIPLSSYKPDTYDSMYESISLKKISDIAVIRINNMIPIVDEVIHPVDFSSITDGSYKNLLQNEYKIIKSREKEIRRDARIVYFYRTNFKNEGRPLYKICCDFRTLESAAQEWVDGVRENKTKILVKTDVN